MDVTKNEAWDVLVAKTYVVEAETVSTCAVQVLQLVWYKCWCF